MEKIQLPPAKQKGIISLEESIFRRKSIRKFQSKEIEKEKISQLLWSAQGKASPVSYTHLTLPTILLV